MTDAKEVFLKTVCPILGVFIGSIMYCSPCKACWNVRVQQKLGDLNPIPFAVTFASSSTWVAYGFLGRDFWMFPQNIVGATAAIFNSLVCYGFAPRKVQDIMLLIITGSCLAMPLLGVISSFVCSHDQGVLLWGYVSNAITIAYYGAPLSTAYEVVHSRNSSSIYPPLALTNLLNALLWTAYGFAVMDLFIVVPNLIGGIFTLLLLVLRLIYPAQQPAPGKSCESQLPLIPGTDDQHRPHCDSPVPVAVVTLERSGSKGKSATGEGSNLQQRATASLQQGQPQQYRL